MKRFKLLGWGVVLLAFGLLVVRTFFFAVYCVDSPSMEPILHGVSEGGDCLLVAYGDGKDLERYDMVVIMPPGETEPFVKRVVALPGEKVAVRNGDLWIDGAISRPEMALVEPVPIFDEEHYDLERAFRLGPLWVRAEEGWKVDAREVNRGANAGLMFMRLGLKDHYFGPAREFVDGQEDVSDAIVECLVRAETPGTVLRLGLAEQWDTFEAALTTESGGSASLVLLRNRPEGREVLHESQVNYGEGAHELRLGNLNDTLFLWIDGELLLEIPYAGNSFLSNDQTARKGSPATDRVYLGASEGVAVFSGIRVFRDYQYTPRGSFALDQALHLGPSEIFVLGDNSRVSEDGRDWGPTDLGEVIGKPVGIVWPPDRIRRFRH